MKKNMLILIDIQKEYISEERPFYLKGIEPSLERCKQLLLFARLNNWEVVHVQHSNGTESSRFNPKTTFFNFIDGFEPLESELHFVKNDFSCYSNVEFSNYISNFVKENDQQRIIVCGYNTVMCCLSTLEEAKRKNHKMELISDASYAKALEGYSEKETHDFMISLYKAKSLAKIIESKQIIIEPKLTFSKSVSLFTSNDKFKQAQLTVNLPNFTT